ncbi:hypothetical protein B9G55_11370 [Saccharibacillus sp. O16]|nr:hypothetical protein B9G55_11370 [Saccharibacillus sp. O16]
MTTWIAALRSERIKLGRSQVLLLAVFAPLLSVLIGLLSNMNNLGTGAEAWEGLLLVMAMFHAMFFLPMMTGIFSAFVCRYEHAGGGWKQILSLPVSRTALYMAKLLTVAGALALAQILFSIGLLVVGMVKGMDIGSVPWGVLGTRLLSGFIACLPLAALQLFVSTMWSSFAAPLVLNMIFTVPNILIANSATVGPYYPWVQPMLAMIPNSGGYDFGAFSLPLENLMVTVVGSFVLFLAAGLIYFVRKPV